MGLPELGRDEAASLRIGPFPSLDTSSGSDPGLPPEGSCERLLPAPFWSSTGVSARSQRVSPKAPGRQCGRPFPRAVEDRGSAEGSSGGISVLFLTACGETLKASIRGAQRRGGGVWGGVSPPYERRWSESRSDSPHQPVVKAPRTHTNAQIRRAGRPGARAGCFHHRLLRARSPRRIPLNFPPQYTQAALASPREYPE